MVVGNGVSESISEREREIIVLLEQGLTNGEIADRLFLSKNTIKWYVQQLNQKLNTNSREEIVVEAKRLNLLTTDDNARSTWRPHNNLPRQTTPFIGREIEIDESQRLLDREGLRLLTIVAPGGMGKTRIALELAEQQLNTYPDGVYFVPLQATNDKSTVLTHIADAIGFHLIDHDQTEDQQILNFLSDKTLLLVLDNFEQVIDGAKQVNQILLAASEVTILVTSREKLNLISETIYVLQGLRYPPLESAEDVRACDAVLLLTRAAQRMRSNWDITHSNIKAVKRFIALTEGMPLAILLATSWLDIYTLDRICDEIQKSVDILSTTMRDIPERHRSIRAIFDHTWGNLPDEDRAILMKMSTFRGGFSVEAAESITGAKAVQLQRLVMKAIIHRTSDGRFEIHELLRQYAAEQLTAAGYGDEIRSAHMTYYAESLSDLEASLKDRRQLDAIDAINADFQNVLASWQWACDTNQPAILSSMLEPLQLFMLLTSRLDRYATLLDDAIHWFEDRNVWQLLTQLHVYHADALIEQSLTRQSFDIMKQVEPDLHNMADSKTRAIGWRTLSRASYILGDPEASFDYAETLLNLSHEMNDLWYLAQAHYALTLITGLWNADEPLEHIERSLTLAQQTGDRYWLSQGYVLGGLMLSRMGNIEKAQAYTENALKIAEELRNVSSVVAALGNLSALAKAQGNWHRSETLMQEAIQLADIWGYSHYHADLILRLCELRLIQDDLAGAESAANRVIQLIEGLQYPATHSQYHSVRSAIAEFQGDYAAALHDAKQATSYIRTNMNWSLTHHAVKRLAWALCCTDDFTSVRPYLIQIIKQELQGYDEWGLVNITALLSIFFAHNGHDKRATGLLGIVDHHHIQAAWLQKHPKLTSTRTLLRQKLGGSAYQTALKQGGMHEMRVVLTEIYDELEAN